MAPRSYTSAKRDAAAVETRTRVLRAAATLMVERGYGRTTVRAVAAAAEVSLQTVNSLGPKSRLIAEALALEFMGDPDATELGSAEVIQQIMADPDTEAALREYVEVLSAANARSCRLAWTMKAAADTDDAVRDLVRAGEEHRRRDMLLAAGWMLGRGLIAPDQLTSTADVLALVTSVETALHFLVACSWSREQYAAWLSLAIRRMVLTPAAVDPREGT